jgi:hypothetical protein
LPPPNQKTTEKEDTTMTFKEIFRFVIVVLIAGAAILTLSLGTASSAAQKGQLHAVKECAGTVLGLPGDYCTFTSSSLAQIPVNSRLIYEGVANIPIVGLLDTNVVLDDMTGNGNRALGRCTLDQATFIGLCTFSDGTGALTGFQARLVVTCPGENTNATSCSLEGTYSFSPQPPR